MADNDITAAPNTTPGNAAIASDDIGGVHFQRIKLIHGADGTNDGDVSAVNPLPIEISDGTDTALVSAAGALNVDGSAVTQPISAASLPLPTGAATAAAQLPDGHNVTIDNAAGASAVNIQDGGNTITVDGTVTANAGSGPWPVTDNAGSLTVDAPVATPVNVQISDGTDTALVSAAGALNIDGSAVTQPISAASLPLPSGAATSANQLPDGHNVTVDNASGGSAVNIQDGGNSITVDQATASNLNAQVVGSVAHDAADSGNPQKIGAKSINFGANPTEVAAADRTDLYATNAGQLFVIGGHPNVVTIRANYTAAQTDTAIASTTEKFVVTRVSVMADNANTVDVQARIGFGATTTPTTTGVLLSHPGIAAGSGVTVGDGSGILGVGAAGEDIRITSEVPTTGSIDVVVSYYEISA